MYIDSVPYVHGQEEDYEYVDHTATKDVKYYYKIYTDEWYGPVSAMPTDGDAVPIPEPPVISIGDVGAGFFDVQIDQGSDYANGYSVEYGPLDQSFPWSETLSGDSLFHISDSRLTSGQTYEVHMYAVNLTGSSDYSNVVTFDINPPSKPATPTGSVHVVGPGTDTGWVGMSWSPNPEPDIAGYRVYCFNSTEYQEVADVQGFSWSSLGARIWPTDAEILDGRYNLHADGSGGGMKNDPHQVYTNSPDDTYNESINYWLRIRAYNSHGNLSEFSDAWMPTLPGASGELLDDETWADHVRVDGEVAVPGGLTLAIWPGTVVKLEQEGACARSTGGTIDDQGATWVPDIAVMAHDSTLLGHYFDLEEALTALQSGQTVWVDGEVYVRDLYVAPGGDDANSGTEASPWRTIQHAVDQAVPGSIIKVMDDNDEATDDYTENITVHKSLTIERYNTAEELWETDETLTMKGKKVFSEEKKATKELMKISKDKKHADEEVKRRATVSINNLLSADEALVSLAIDQAITLGGDAKEINKAEKEMDKAQEEIGKDHFDKSIDHYKKAWEHAQKAIKKVPEEEGDLCAGHMKPQALMMEYTGEGEEASYHSQDPKKVSVVGDPDFASPVHIVASDKKTPDDPKANVWFRGDVALYGIFNMDATAGGESHLKADTYVHIFDASGTLLQTIRFHTSGSQPLYFDDQFGSLVLVEFVGAVAKPVHSTAVDPERFSLMQNHPNPFNPITTIAYSLPEAGHVTLVIYNIIGQWVATLVSRYQEVGHYEAIWDGTWFANGIYFYRLKAGRFAQAKRMLLLK